MADQPALSTINHQVKSQEEIDREKAQEDARRAQDAEKKRQEFEKKLHPLGAGK